MLRRLFSRKQYGGIIAGHELADWWDSCFDEQERALIRQQVSGPTSCFNHLDEGPTTTLDMHKKQLLASLATWFQKDDVRPLGRKIIAYAEPISANGLKPLELHFVLVDMIRFYYRSRKDGPNYLALCEARCRDQIQIARTVAAAWKEEYPRENLPVHPGYGRLCWLLDKRNDREGATLREEGEAMGWTVSI